MHHTLWEMRDTRDPHPPIQSINKIRRKENTLTFHQRLSHIHGRPEVDNQLIRKGDEKSIATDLKPKGKLNFCLAEEETLADEQSYFAYHYRGKMGKSEEKLSLVLSIFKGENFVCKSSQSLRCQVEARCCDTVLLSGVVHISATNSEPNFNFQLAWQFTRRQLRELRENKSPVKVRCLLLDGNNCSTELGYAVLHVRDACPSHLVDPTKAQAYTLLGTKNQWKDYHPKLFMQLQIEDYSMDPVGEIVQKKVDKVAVVNPEDSKRKSKVTIDPNVKIEALELVDKKPRVELGVMDYGERFLWRISEDDGCFQLGKPSDCDDLYIFDTTIVSASNLHLLWNGRSPKNAAGDDFVWQIRYKAYGCDIKSDPFVLSKEDISRRTFIGDKATARIRAASPLFFEYLKEACVEFHVLRYELSSNQDLINEEVMGISFADLQDLALENVTELRATLEIVSEWGYPKIISQSEKPEVRVCFQLCVKPELFKQSKTMLSPVSMSIPDEIPDFNENFTNENLYMMEKREEQSSVNARESSTSNADLDSDENGNQLKFKQSKRFSQKINMIPSSSQSSISEDEFYCKPDTVDSTQKELKKRVKTETQGQGNNTASNNKEKEKSLQHPSSAAKTSSEKKRALEEEMKRTEMEYREILAVEDNAKEQQRKECNKPTKACYISTARKSENLLQWEAEKKEEFQEELKRKETAYLNILAKEAAARDEQREKALEAKCLDVRNKEKELLLLKSTLSERDEDLRRREIRLAEAAAANSETIERTKLEIRRLQQEHKIELNALKRRAQEHDAELKSYKSKIDVMQMKLEEKEQQIDKLKDERYHHPDFQLTQQLKLIEQENKLLKKHIAEIEQSRDKYKKQSQTLCVKIAKLQEDRDQQLKEENEKLRIQIAASAQHKELKKERKAVSDISEHLRLLKDRVSPKKNEKNEKKSVQSPKKIQKGTVSNEEEIQRLTNARRGLLETGAYTKFDEVIKELERKIISLADSQLK